MNRDHDKLQAATAAQVNDALQGRKRKEPKPDKAERRRLRREKWDADVERCARARFGIVPVGPDMPDLLEDSFNTNRSAVHTVALIGSRYGLMEVSTWDPTSW